MSQPLLSILIPTVVGREAVLALLVSDIKDQISEGKLSELVEIKIYPDNKELTIGEKRELLYAEAKGLFSWQIDDDDIISFDAIHSILDEIRLNGASIDCITFLEKCLMNGKQYTCKHSLVYDDWHDNHDGFDFVRTPFYKDVIKTEIARSVPFEHIRYGEDHAWSRALKPHLKSEIHIPKELYIYQHNSKPEEFNERYGFNQR
jgi:hypothetical protein